MGLNPVNAWDTAVAVAQETTLGVPVAPASQAAYGLQFLEQINSSLGPAEVGVIRPKQDRGPGRGMQNGWVEGRVMPAAWSLDTSLKTRAAVDTPSPLLPLLKAGGLLHTVNAATNVTITVPATPIESGVFAGATLTQIQGSGLAAQKGERLRGCVTRSINISGAANELMVKLAGVGIGKTTAAGQAGVLGKIDSITLASGVVTSVTITAAESKRLGLGYYLCESEVIEVTACTPGGTTATIARGALGSTAAAHTAQPLVPYRPAPTYSGSPIAEPTSTVTLGGVALRCRSWSIDISTGMDLVEPETGSRYSQRAKYGRCDVKVSLQLVLDGDGVSLLGQVQTQENLALALVQGTGVGGIFTANMPNCALDPFQPPDTNNDISVVDVTLRVRDGAATAGSDLINLVLT
jgi:hypothetical protein